MLPATLTSRTSPVPGAESQNPAARPVVLPSTRMVRAPSVSVLGSRSKIARETPRSSLPRTRHPFARGDRDPLASGGDEARTGDGHVAAPVAVRHAPDVDEVAEHVEHLHVLDGGALHAPQLDAVLERPVLAVVLGAEARVRHRAPHGQVAHRDPAPAADAQVAAGLVALGTGPQRRALAVEHEIGARVDPDGAVDAVAPTRRERERAPVGDRRDPEVERVGDVDGAVRRDLGGCRHLAGVLGVHAGRGRDRQGQAYQRRGGEPSHSQNCDVIFPIAETTASRGSVAPCSACRWSSGCEYPRGPVPNTS